MRLYHQQPVVVCEHLMPAMCKYIFKKNLYKLFLYCFFISKWHLFNFYLRISSVMVNAKILCFNCRSNFTVGEKIYILFVLFFSLVFYFCVSYIVIHWNTVVLTERVFNRQHDSEICYIMVLVGQGHNNIFILEKNVRICIHPDEEV